jgi:nucleoside-triphosphatase THEP1
MSPLVSRNLNNRPDPGFTPPERIPWSELGPHFIAEWGHEGNKMRGEHIEICGQTGSGKSYAEATILQQRAQRWNTAEIVIVTKESDDSIPLLGWQVCDKFEDIQKYRQCIFWPKTNLQGAEREKFHEEQIYDLLSSLWGPDANVVIAFDEIGYVEDLSQRLKKLIRMYWREGRSHNISIIAMKQRPVGVQRDQHSESRWKIVFPPADQGDMKRFAEMLGRVGDWQPVLESVDQRNHEFVIRNSVTKDAYISWMDEKLEPVKEQGEQKSRSTSEWMTRKRPGDNSSPER